MNERLNELFNSISTTITSASNKNLLYFDISIKQIIHHLKILQESNKSLYIVGNGGSAGIASHAANDFINMCNIKAETFHDISVLTCLTNDYGYSNAFSKLLECHSDSGDILFAISSSGNSDNIINAVNSFKAKNSNNIVVTLSGFSENNKLRKLGDINFYNKSESYGIVEISHQFILHFIADKYCGNC